MFRYWGPINMYDLLTGIAFLFPAWYMDHALAPLVPFPRWKLRLGIAGSVLVFVYGGALIPYLWRLINDNPAPFYLAAGRYFHSVFLSVLAYAVLAFKLLRIPVWKGLDVFIVATLGASAIGRIGCFLEGCCRGKPTWLPWGLEYPTFPGIPLHPTQLYMLFVETAIILFLIRFDRKKQGDGQTFWIGVWLYSIYRIWIETLRVNPIFFWGMSHAQAFSVLTLALSSWVLTRMRRQVRTQPAAGEAR